MDRIIGSQKLLKKFLKSESSLLTSLPRFQNLGGLMRQTISCYDIFSLIEIYGTSITVQVVDNVADY